MARRISILAIAAIFLLAGSSALLADSHKHGKCEKSQRYGGSFDSKVFAKAHFILKNEDELDLTEDQAKKIKDLKAETKKSKIQKQAEIDVLAVDIKSEMYGDKIDIEALNKLIDQKYEAKAQKAKLLAGAYAQLKDTLTDEQKDTLKDLYSKCKKD